MVLRSKEGRTVGNSKAPKMTPPRVESRMFSDSNKYRIIPDSKEAEAQATAESIQSACSESRSG